MSKFYIGASVDTEYGTGRVLDIFYKGEELFAEVRLDTGNRVFVGIEQSQLTQPEIYQQ